MVKGRNFWLIPLPQSCIWIWRKTKKLRSTAIPLIKHVIDNGRRTIFWIDNWHSQGPLLHLYSSSIMLASGLSKEAGVDNVIRNNSRHWPQTCFSTLQDIQTATDGIPSPDFQQADSLFVWHQSVVNSPLPRLGNI
ncbi:Uncharacterized protein TCM_045593 [Theobroma cacao]|uniref:Reverse transcriptase zinc-binding domain-containing protein n=1 Tax=Theobroma cacao TaxID=3641 RepID=A0A061FZK8_THECC|nr:Uncharacterized protein TCM_045593 [Theobroma cacao]